MLTILLACKQAPVRDAVPTPAWIDVASIGFSDGVCALRAEGTRICWGGGVEQVEIVGVRGLARLGCYQLDQGGVACDDDWATGGPFEPLSWLGAGFQGVFGLDSAGRVQGVEKGDAPPGGEGWAGLHVDITGPVCVWEGTRGTCTGRAVGADEPAVWPWAGRPVTWVGGVDGAACAQIGDEVDCRLIVENADSAPVLEDLFPKVPGGVELLALTWGIACGVLDGRFRCWVTSDDRSGSPPELGRPEKVACTGHDCCAVEGGELYCWGEDFDGVLSDAPSDVHVGG